jgi:hypothetical protein
MAFNTTSKESIACQLSVEIHHIMYFNRQFYCIEVILHGFLINTPAINTSPTSVTFMLSNFDFAVPILIVPLTVKLRKSFDNSFDANHVFLTMENLFRWPEIVIGNKEEDPSVASTRTDIISTDLRSRIPAIISL